MNDTYHFKLFKNHVLCTRSDRPVLLSADGVSGAYHVSAILPGSDSTAFEVVLRACARESRPNDPPVGVEDGGDLDTYMLQFLNIRSEEIEKARLITRIMDRMNAKRKVVENK